MSKSITQTDLKAIAGTVKKDDSARNFAERAVTTNGISKATENNFSSTTNPTVFSDEIKTGSVMDQKQSGRCWLFAALSTVRHQIAVEKKIENFELSSSYCYFWDKLERANIFYEKVISSRSQKLEEPKLVHLFNAPQEDGGWWEYAASLIAKYGVVPKSVMEESFSTTNSQQLNKVLNTKLRKDAVVLRQISQNASDKEIQGIKKPMLSEVYRMLTIAIGTPPTVFDYAYRDTDGTFHREQGLTPLQFLNKYSKHNFDDYVSLMNYPSPTRSFGATYSLEGGCNLIGGKNTLFLNVDISTMRDLAYKQIKLGEPIFFGCDIGVGANKKGYMSNDTYDFESAFNVDLSFDKADRLATRESTACHAVTITGMDCLNKKPVQWKVENSWGEKVGNKGYFTMSDEWFKDDGFVVVIRKSLLDAKLKKALNTQPVIIPDWDPINMFSPR